jgi:hypothetical protein
MRLLSLLEDERKSGAIWYVLFRQSPDPDEGIQVLRENLGKFARIQGIKRLASRAGDVEVALRFYLLRSDPCWTSACIELYGPHCRKRAYRKEGPWTPRKWRHAVLASRSGDAAVLGQRLYRWLSRPLRRHWQRGAGRPPCPTSRSPVGNGLYARALEPCGREAMSRRENPTSLRQEHAPIGRSPPERCAGGDDEGRSEPTVRRSAPLQRPPLPPPIRRRFPADLRFQLKMSRQRTDTNAASSGATPQR